MFFTKKICRLVLIIILAIPTVYAEDGIHICADEEKGETTCLLKTTKSSDIPAKRDYPINSTINPCVNFYEYVCSSVITGFKLREDRSYHTFSLNDASERLLEFKKEYFLELTTRTPASVMESEIKNYYLACMNQESGMQEESDYVEETKKQLEKITTREEFINLVTANIIRSSQLSFINFITNEANLDNPEYNDLYFETQLMSLPGKSYYKNTELVEDLKMLIEEFFVAIGDKSPKRKAELVFNFEKELAEFYPTPQQIDELLTSRTEALREDLIQNYPNLKLEKFLLNIPKHIVIRNIIGNEVMNFLDRKLGTAPLEELKSIYLYFQLSPIMDEAYPGFFNKKLAFRKQYLGGPNKRPERRERCTISTMSDFAKEVDFVLLPKLFPNFPKEKFIESIEKIRKSLKTQLENNAWLSTTTKEEAILKIQKAKLALVSPDNEKDWDFNPRSDYTIDKPIANKHRLRQLSIEKQLKNLQNPTNTNRWYISPLTVNANYNPSYNRFELPIGILQYPFYDPTETEEGNLGAIGAVIGHELGHAIDNHGNRFNANGVFTTWINNENNKTFTQRTQFLVTQFNNIDHNGQFTLTENIADLVGLTTAYQAAFSIGNNNNQEMKRKFFLQFARMWCGVEREGFKKWLLKNDPHALRHARVNEQMKHQVGFKEAYSCKPGDPMVLPENEIVKIW